MGTLYIVSTPIGNLEDITIRAVRILSRVSYIACEDTRTTGLLLSEIRKRYGKVFGFGTNEVTFIPFSNENEAYRYGEIITHLEEGEDVALVSDAGTPIINDPGFLLVRESSRRGIKIVPVPGPHAGIAALSASALPAGQYLYIGYPPEKDLRRKTQLLEVDTLLSAAKKTIQPTVLYYCAPHKLITFLTDILGILGNYQIVITRELTKIHEEVWHGSVSEALKHFNKPVGEFVILIPPQEL